MTDYPKPTSGGWYELSNGEKVQGREAAEDAEAALEPDEGHLDVIVEKWGNLEQYRCPYCNRDFRQKLRDAGKTVHEAQENAIRHVRACPRRARE